MTLQDLYQSMPVELHGNIVVAKDKVYVRTTQGGDEYVLLPNGDVALVRSDSDSPLAAIRQDLSTNKAKLGV